MASVQETLKPAGPLQKQAGLHLAAAFPWLTWQGLAQSSGMKLPVPLAQ